MHKRFAFPMAEMRDWETDTFDKLERAEFDAPRDRRRFFAAGDNHLAGVGDGFERETPAWINSVGALRSDFPVYGGVIEPNECLTRLVGQENAMLWIGEYPERMGAVIDRIGAFYLEAARAEIEAAAGALDGLVVWGDVAYKRGTFMSPAYWRKYFAPWLRRMTELAHAHGLPVIYHSCGNVRPIFADFVNMGIDAANPLEAKAGLDAVELRREFGHRIALCGNSDIQVWESGNRGAIRREVLRKLNAAKGGGYIFQSDHSVTSGVAGLVYDGIVKLVREFGTYPLRLGEFDLPVQGPEGQE
jgi:uroporphyrinogen-III decarboxylase